MAAPTGIDSTGQFAATAREDLRGVKRMKRGNPIAQAADRPKLAPDVVDPVALTQLERKQKAAPKPPASLPMGKAGWGPNK